MMIEPFLKWPGGKRWLASQHAHLFPACYRNYLEPFLGGGAVFFRMGPKDALLSDTNEELINAYRGVKYYASAIDGLLKSFHLNHSEAFYYDMRQQRMHSKLERAARFIYLNRTCFNGMYRVNTRGIFNVPIGTKSEVAFPEGYLESVAKALRFTRIKVRDFEQTLDSAAAGDFAFIDPPYTVMHNNNGFIKYNARLFSWADQVRLALAVKRAISRGVSILLSNADHSDVRKLYEGVGEHHQLARSSVLAGTHAGRRITTELLVRHIAS